MPSLINAIVATQDSTRNSRIAGCSPANRDVVKVQPQESTLKSPYSRRCLREESDVDQCHRRILHRKIKAFT
jgi:hypothetical protein